MRIIALTDAASRGKTTSITIAKNEFLEDPEVNSPRELTAYFQVLSNKDFRTVIELLDGYRIAFCTGGDDAATVTDNYQYAVQYNCQLLVTASRISKNDSWHKMSELMTTQGNDGLLVKAIDFYDNSPVFHDKANNYLRISELTAKHLVNVIKYAIARP